jgi:S1-C subfamily serine protease
MQSTKSSIEDLIQNSLVQIFNDNVLLDHIRPWKTRGRSSSTGTGFCVDVDGTKYILTNAHCVDSSTLLQVQPYGHPTKLQAHVVFSMAPCDLALLKFDDENSWKHLTPLPFKVELPAILSTVYVIGYPLGGTNISFTKGIVSRIIETKYSFSDDTENIAIQVSAQINGGNSGGPCVDELGQFIGIAFQKLTNSEGMGEIIPVQIYRDVFLKYFKNYGSLSPSQRILKTQNIPDLGILYQCMENIDMRKYYKMSPEQSGILVTYVKPLSKLRSHVFAEDVILDFNGTKIENNGNVQLVGHNKIFLSFHYLIASHPPETSCNLTVLRKGESHVITVCPEKVDKIIECRGIRSAGQYLIIGGCVFTVPSLQYITQMFEEERLMSNYIKALLTYQDVNDPNSEIILLNSLFPNEVNVGYSYSMLSAYPLTKFNGTKIKNMRHLCELYDSNTEPYIKLQFEHIFDESGEILIMDTAKVKASTASILKENLIPFDRSEELIPPSVTETPI